MTLFGVLLDSGCIVQRFTNRAEAHALAVVINEVRDRDKRGGILVTWRRAIGVVRITNKPFTPCQPGGSRGGKRGKRAPATSSKAHPHD
ncbi:hypothetical protein [Novosphingobium sp. FKTRR1]|uniref:hypothetical protein n=1 Tax=Novosphingobium sp. FKTRR1 TaxID=2879118 RepID=UPI001CF0185D|nr:hypothetical protein [Novosphingobium sp. FKTRR1]